MFLKALKKGFTGLYPSIHSFTGSLIGPFCQYKSILGINIKASSPSTIVVESDSALIRESLPGLTADAVERHNQFMKVGAREAHDDSRFSRRFPPVAAIRIRQRATMLISIDNTSVSARAGSPAGVFPRQVTFYFLMYRLHFDHIAPSDSVQFQSGDPLGPIHDINR